jgi:PhnB protein
MTLLIPYLVFPGSCREALHFYKEVFNGEILKMDTFEHMPMELTDEEKNRIFDSEFSAGSLQFKASDDLSAYPVTRGTNVSMFLICQDSHERRRIFEALSEEGKIIFPLDDEFGMCTDKFGIQWMLTLNDE